MKFSTKNFFSKGDQIRSKLWICSHLLKRSLVENFICYPVTTKWVGNTWERICHSKDMVKRSFKKCGITTNVDDSENSQVNIRRLEDNVMPVSEFHLETSSSEESEDEECWNRSLPTMIMVITVMPVIFKKAVPQMRKQRLI